MVDWKKKFFGYVLVYSFWVLIIGISVIGMFLTRNFFLVLMGDLGVDMWSWAFFDKALLILSGIGVLILIISTEFYLTNGLRLGLLLKRTARIVGLELLVIVAFQLYISIFRGNFWRPSLSLLLIGAQLILGLVLFVYSLARKIPENPVT